MNRDAERAASVAIQDMGNPESALIGPPEAIIDKLEQLQGWGVDYVLFLMPMSITNLRAFAREVMPALRQKAQTIKAVP